MAHLSALSADLPHNVTKTGATPVSGVPAHHKPGGGFRNPWDSFKYYSFQDAARLFLFSGEYQAARAAPPPEDQRVPVVRPDFDAMKSFPQRSKEGKAKVRATWIGHACLFVQMGGVNILADPCCSERCSPSQWIGQLPEIDVVLISHSHYDHLDSETIEQLGKLKHGPKTTYFVPLGNKEWFAKHFSKHAVVEGDWWDEWKLTKESVKSEEKDEVTIACTPCQHFSGRTLWDRNDTLWSSWVVRSPSASFFFGGDTGYRAVPREWGDMYANLDNLPACPAFKEIGDKYGPFDVSAIPIGAYSPRWFMSPIHCSPEDSVELHKDVRSKKSVGMHWGTFSLTDEPYWEPPERLKRALAAKGIPEDEFVVVDIGGAVEV